MRRAILPCVAVVATVAIVGAAAARAPTALEDPNDTRGPMDALTVTFDPVEPPTWAIVLEQPWKPKATWDRAFAFVYMDVSGDARGDYYAIVRSTGRELRASLWRDPRRGNDIKVRPLAVLWRSPREVALSIPLASMDVGRYRTVYRWWVVTTFTGNVCRRACVDRVPDEGSVEQPLPGTSPTPTPSPTPSPTTSPTP